MYFNYILLYSIYFTQGDIFNSSLSVQSIHCKIKKLKISHSLLQNFMFNSNKIGWVFRDCVDEHLVLKNNCHNEDAFALQLASPHESHTCWIKTLHLRPRYYSDIKCEGQLWKWKRKNIPNDRGTQMHK